MESPKIVSLKGPDGEFYDVSSSNVEEALNNGFSKVSDKELEEHFFRQEERDSTGVEAFARSAADSASFGVSRVIEDKVAKSTGIGLTGPEQAIQDEESPNASGLGMVAGFVAGGLPSVATKAGVAITKLTAKELAKIAGKEGVTIADRIIQNKLGRRVISTAAGGAVEGAAQGVNAEITDSVFEDRSLSAEKMVAAVGFGSLAGGTLNAAGYQMGKAASKASNKIGETLEGVSPNKIMSKLFGPSEETLENYSKIFAEKDSLPVLAELEKELYQKALKIKNDFSDDKMSLREAKSEFNYLKAQALRDHDLNINDIKISREELNSQFKQYEDTFLSDIKDNIFDKSKLVSNDLNSLEKKAIDSSKGITEGLKDKVIDATPVLKEWEDLSKSYRERGTEAAMKTADYIDEMIVSPEMIKIFSKDANAASVKKFIINFDKEIKWKDWALGDVDTIKNTSKKQMRHFADDTLKNAVPEYRKAMEPVRESFELAKSLRKYSDPADAAARLRRFDDIKSEYELPLLRKLEVASGNGNKYVDDLEKYVQRKDIIKGSPERAALTAKDAELAALKDKNVKYKIQDDLISSPQGQSVKAFQEKIVISEAAAKELQGITPESIPTLLKRAVRGDSVALEQVRVLENALKSPELVETMKKIGTVENLEKSISVGGLRSMIYSVIGSVIGSTVGFSSGIVGFFVGRTVAKSSPKVAKWIIDKYASGEMSSMAKMIQFDNRVTKSIAKFKNNFFDNNKMELKPIIFKSILHYNLHGEVDSTDKQTQFKKNIEALQELNSNQSKTLDILTDRSANFSDVDEQIGGSMISTTNNGISYLNSKIPPNPFQGKLIAKDYKYPEAEISKFTRHLAGVQDPIGVLDDMARGVVSVEGIEAIKAVYPNIYKKISTQFIETVSDPEVGLNLSYQNKLSLSLLLDVPVDNMTDPLFIISLQGNFNPAETQREDNGGNQPKLGKIKVSNNSQTSIDRITNK